METGTKVNVIPLNMNLPCYNTVDKATSIMSKNIELDIINYMSLHHGTHCDHKTLKRAIPDLSYVPLK